MMDDWSSYPPVEPNNFDLIVIGTSLPESILAAAVSAAGKTVLHLDSNHSYGCHFASLPLQDFTDFLQNHSKTQSSPPQIEPKSSGEFNALPLVTRPVYSLVEVNVYSPEIIDKSSKFSLDLAGPRVLFCADSMVDLILQTDIYQYMDFKSVESSFICEGAECELWRVPDSRSAIFKDKILSLPEKNQLMRFFKLVQKHYEEKSDERNAKISDEDLESPFVEFMSKKIGMTSKLKSVILYAISMADYEQDNVELCKNVLKTKEGIDRLIVYHSSIGRFPNAPGAMIYPIYGQGELPQAFCRRAAVKGCLYVLRMPVVALLVDKDVGSYKGVRLATGQELFSHRLILSPSYVVPSGLVQSPPNPPQKGINDLGTADTKQKVARAICITNTSLKSDVANCLVFLPPQSLCPEQQTSIRAFQLSSNVATCPPNLFVVYLSTVCEDALQGKKLMNAAIDALFTIPMSKDPKENCNVHESEFATKKVKPALLWSILYVQDQTAVEIDSVSSTFMPDGNLLYKDLVEATIKLFHTMYPNEVFLPKVTSSDTVVEDVESDL